MRIVHKIDPKIPKSFCGPEYFLMIENLYHKASTRIRVPRPEMCGQMLDAFRRAIYKEFTRLGIEILYASLMSEKKEKKEK